MKNKETVSVASDIDLTILFNLSDDIQCVLNACGDFEKVNQRLIQHSGQPESQLLESSFVSLIHPQDKEKVNSHLLTFQSGRTIQFQARIIQPLETSETLLWQAVTINGYTYLSAKITDQNIQDLPLAPACPGHEANTHILHGVDEKIRDDFKEHRLRAIEQSGSDLPNLLQVPHLIGVVANSRDDTSQREMQTDVWRNSRKFKNLIEFNQDGFFTLNCDWQFTSLNSVVRNYKGLPKGFIIGANIWNVMPRGPESLFYVELTRAFEQSIAVHFKEFSTVFNRWIEVSAYPFEESLTVMIRDITELKIQTLTLKLEKEVLEMTAASVYSISELMDHLLRGFEEIHNGFKTSFALTDKNTSKLQRLSAPSIPELLADISIEPGSGQSPCARAVSSRMEVYIPDILSIEIPTNLRQIFNSYNILSSRSIPVINKNQEVLGVLTIFNTGHLQALVEEVNLIHRLGPIIQLLLENNQGKKDVELSNERFQLTMRATSDSIWDLNLMTRQIYRGKGFDSYYNQKSGMEAIESKKWEQNVHPEDLERVDKALETALITKDNLNWIAEYRYKKKDGSYALVIDKCFIVRDKEGRAIRIAGAVQDITEIKKNQEKLIQSEENYKNMFFNNPTPMWTYDMESKNFTMVNDAALELYGYCREEFLMLDLFSIRIEEDHEKLKLHLQSVAFLEGQNISYEWTHLKKDKTKMVVDVVSHPLLINGRKSRLVAIKDITEKQKDRQEILGQNKRLKEIAQISSHETRKPLANILGLVNLFDKENLNNPFNKEIVQYLETSANELDTVIHHIVEKTWRESEASSALKPE